ncbi:MAG: DNA repair protein RadC [Paracoccaceae bacterium]
MDVPKSAPSYLKDHRQRLRERFRKGGVEAVLDYELLELVLFRAIPRQDVKPLARRLIDHFGDFNRVITAPAERLTEVQGVGHAVVLEFKITQAVAQKLTRSRVLGRCIVSSWRELLDYCHTHMSHRETEQFRVLYLNRKNILILDEAQGEGSIDHVPVYPRNIVKRALEVKASAIILVHNHPSGDPTPSPQDIDMTRQVAEAAAPLGITLHDHLVIGASTEISFRTEGYL